MRSLVYRLEIGVGAFLVLLCIAHLGWCQWSLPRHGREGPHGLEAGVCNWGATLLNIILGVIAVLTIISGVVGYRVRSKTVPWYAAQVPAMAAWAWVIYAFIYAVFVYPH